MFKVKNNHNALSNQRRNIPGIKLTKKNKVPSLLIDLPSKIQTTNIQTVLDNITEIDIPESTTSINVNGVILKEVDSPDLLTKDTVYINRSTKKAQIKSSFSGLSANIKINKVIDALVSNEVYVQLPQLFDIYNIEGVLSITRGLDNLPSCEVEAVVYKEYTDQLIQYLKDYNRQYLICNIPFRISEGGFSVTISNLNQKETNRIRISFESWYKKYLDQTTYKKLNPLDDKSDIPYDCVSEIVYIKNKTLTGENGKLKYPLSQLASKVGTSLSSSSMSFIEYEKSLDNNATTTLSNEINNSLESESLVSIYSLTSGIHLRRINSGNYHAIPLNQVISDINYSQNLKDLEIKPTFLTWNKEEPKQDLQKFESKKPRFTTKKIKLNKVVNEGKMPQLDRINDMSLVFDNSGQRKVDVVTTLERDIVIKEETSEYGLVFYGKDVVDSETGKFKNIPAQSCWQKIKESTTYHQYDKYTGYYLGNYSIGWFLGRFKIESNEVETQGLTYDLQEATNPIDIAYYGAELDLYTFIKVPTFGYENYTLLPLSAFYEAETKEDRINAMMSAYLTWQECTPSGKLITKSMKDPRFVEPMFVAKKENYYTGFRTRPNPENINKDEEEPALPPLTVGEEKYQLEETKIFRSKNTSSSIGFTTSGEYAGTLIADKQDREDRYQTINTVFVAQDANFRNSTYEVTKTETKGRPGIATKKESQYELQENLDTEKTKEKVDDNNIENLYDYYIYTAPYSANSIPDGGSWSFNVNSFSKAFQKAVDKFQKISLLNGNKISFDMITSNLTSIMEGDTITLVGTPYICKVNSVRINVQYMGIINGERKTKGYLSIEGTLLKGYTGSLQYFKKAIKKSPEKNENNSDILITSIKNNAFALKGDNNIQLIKRGV